MRADGCAAARVAARGEFESLATGFPRFDLRPLGNVTAPGGEPLSRALLSVEMLMFAYAFDESVTGASDGADGLAAAARGPSPDKPTERTYGSTQSMARREASMASASVCSATSRWA